MAKQSSKKPKKSSGGSSGKSTMKMCPDSLGLARIDEQSNDFEVENEIVNSDDEHGQSGVFAFGVKCKVKLSANASQSDYSGAEDAMYVSYDEMPVVAKSDGEQAADLEFKISQFITDKKIPETQAVTLDNTGILCAHQQGYWKVSS